MENTQTQAQQQFNGPAARQPVTEPPKAPAAPTQTFLSPEMRQELVGIVGEAITDPRAMKALEARYQELAQKAPLFNGTWKRRLQVGALVIVGAGIGVGGTLLVQHYAGGADAKKTK